MICLQGLNMSNSMQNNIDDKTVAGFGDEWTRFDQTQIPTEELNRLFNQYFKIFPWDMISDKARGFDLGCGSGRWAKLVSEKVGHLHCIDASSDALNIAKSNLSDKSNCTFHLASVDSIPLLDDSMDFGYSLGVLHHVPKTSEGIKACVRKLKIGAPFLIYLYYAFDNKPTWFVLLWQMSELFRKTISKLPFPLRYILSQLMATVVYLPLTRFSLLMEKLGFDVSNFPLSSYRTLSFYTMRTDALDRFGTRLEQRFSASEIVKMMKEAGLTGIKVSDSSPYWCVLGFKEHNKAKDVV